MVKFSSATQPYLRVDFHAELFDLTSVNTELEISNNGVSFSFLSEHKGILGFHLAATLTTGGNFTADGGFHVGDELPVKGDFLGIHFDFKVGLMIAASLSVSITKGEPAVVDLSYYANINGWRIGTGPGSEPIHITRIADLPRLLMDEMGRNMLNGMEDIINFIFHRDKWLRDHRLQESRDSRDGHRSQRNDLIAEVYESAAVQQQRFEEWKARHERTAQRREMMRSDSRALLREIDSTGSRYRQSHLDEARRVLTQWHQKSAHLKPAVRTADKDPHAAVRQSETENWMAQINNQG